MIRAFDVAHSLHGLLVLKVRLLDFSQASRIVAKYTVTGPRGRRKKVVQLYTDYKCEDNNLCPYELSPILTRTLLSIQTIAATSIVTTQLRYYRLHHYMVAKRETKDPMKQAKKMDASSRLPADNVTIGVEADKKRHVSPARPPR